MYTGLHLLWHSCNYVIHIDINYKSLVSQAHLQVGNTVHICDYSDYSELQTLGSQTRQQNALKLAHMCLIIN